MTFLNMALLGGIFAFNIPLIIHLLNRSRFKVVKWGAMHLLEPILKKNMRRLRLEQLLLLLIRALIPVVLALMMAKPALTGWKALSGGSQGSTVVLLDNSYSMQAAAGTRSNFDVAREQVDQMLRGAARQSEFSILEVGGQVTPMTDQPRTDHQRLQRLLADASAGSGAVNTPIALDKALEILKEARHAKRDVVIVSDFQQVNWEGFDAAARAAYRAQLDALPAEPHITFLHVGKSVKDNVAVHDVQHPDFVLGVGQPLRLRAFLRNYGEADRRNVRVRFTVDGVSEDEQHLAELEPGKTESVFFQHTFRKAGSHWISVTTDEDTVKADNAQMLAINVLERVPVLLVSGQTSPTFGQGETDFLQVALTPYSSKQPDDLRDLLEPQVVPVDDLTSQDLSKYRVVVLANVGAMTDKAVATLEQFVHEGGGLVVFPGDRVSGRVRGWYDSELYKDGKGLLPTRLIDLAGDPSPKSTKFASLARQHYDHPAMQLFNDPEKGNLAAVAFQQWFRLKDVSRDAGPTGTTVLARFEQGDPFLIERKFGEGRVILSAAPCDVDWGNLPTLGNLYVPLMQQIVTYLASRVEPSRNVAVGQPLVALLDREDVGKKLSVQFFPLEGSRSKDGKASTKARTAKVVERGGRGVAEFRRTATPGLYVMQGMGVGPLHFVVSASKKEADLRQLEEPELEQLAEELGAKVVTTADAYLRMDRERRHGREVWGYLFLALIVLIFGELFLQQWLARRRV